MARLEAEVTLLAREAVEAGCRGEPGPDPASLVRSPGRKRCGKGAKAEKEKDGAAVASPAPSAAVAAEADGAADGAAAGGGGSGE